MFFFSLYTNTNHISVAQAAITQSVQRLATGWTVRESYPGGGEIFRTVQTGLGVNPVYCKMGTESFPEVKRPGRGDDHTPTPSTEVKERVELYFYRCSFMEGSRVIFTFTYQGGSRNAACGD